MMYKKLSNPLPPRFGRMYVGNDAKLNHDPAKKDDTVTIHIDNETTFYILVENATQEVIQGEIVGIGPEPKFEYKDWSHGDKIEVSETAVSAIIRAS